jgi:hypothetical protein
VIRNSWDWWKKIGGKSLSTKFRSPFVLVKRCIFESWRYALSMEQKNSRLPQLGTLPERIQLKILNHLDYRSILQLTLVNKQLQKISQNDTIWESAYQKEFEASYNLIKYLCKRHQVPSTRKWKLQFQKKYTERRCGVCGLVFNFFNDYCHTHKIGKRKENGPSKLEDSISLSPPLKKFRVEDDLLPLIPLQADFGTPTDSFSSIAFPEDEEDPSQGFDFQMNLPANHDLDPISSKTLIHLPSDTSSGTHSPAGSVEFADEVHTIVDNPYSHQSSIFYDEIAIESGCETASESKEEEKDLQKEEETYVYKRKSKYKKRNSKGDKTKRTLFDQKTQIK